MAGRDGGAAAAGADGKPAPVTVDPVNDPIPTDWTKNAQDRIRAVIASNKEIEAKAVKAAEERDYVVGVIESTGATPEQFADQLQLMRLMNSADPADNRKALEKLQAQVTALAKAAGVVVPGVDYLEGHDDLKDDLADGKITRERALELAAARDQGRIATERQTRGAQVLTAQQEQTQARADMNALDVRLAGKDANFAAKRAHLVAVLRPVLASLPPSKWAATFENAYKALPADFGKPAPPPPKAAASPDPLRPRIPAGGQAREPKSALEAVMAGISEANGG